MDFAVAFLGNPGADYAGTRHNIGFMVGDRLVSRRESPWIQRDPLYDESVIRFARRSVVLLKPMTYMNLSGRAVKKILNKHQLTPQQLIVVVDEYNFPVGTVKLKAGGSDGGHNGIASVIQDVGTPNFWRLRCGIDREFGPGGLVDYVLSPFPPEQRLAVDAMVEDACDALEAIFKHGPQRAMKEINTQE